jgi:hypothetical protein
MVDRVEYLREKFSFEERFLIIVTRPSRYRGTEFDVLIRPELMLSTAMPDEVDALGLCHGDSVVGCVDFFDPNGSSLPFARSQVYARGLIADWLEEHWKEYSCDERPCADDTFLHVRVRLLYGSKMIVAEVTKPFCEKILVTKQFDGFEIVEIYGPAINHDSWWELFSLCTKKNAQDSPDLSGASYGGVLPI